MTEYEALQEQRKIERGIRRWKREETAIIKVPKLNFQPAENQLTVKESFTVAYCNPGMMLFAFFCMGVTIVMNFIL